MIPAASSLLGDRAAVLISAALASFLAASKVAADDKLDLNNLPREERVRLLRQRTWEVKATRLEGRLRIDGHLDEPDWDRAESRCT